jgi:hypothetical protein
MRIRSLFFVVPNGFSDIWLQGINQADETDNNEFRIECVDKFVKAFRIGIYFLGKAFTRYHTPCKYEHAATQSSPLLLDSHDSLTGGKSKVQRSVTSRREDMRATREENVRSTLGA